MLGSAMPGSGARRVAEMDLRGSDAMRSRVVNAVVAAAMLASLALGASVTWGAVPIHLGTSTGQIPPIETYGEPEGGGGDITRILATRVLRLLIGQLSGISNGTCRCQAAKTTTSGAPRSRLQASARIPR